MAFFAISACEKPNDGPAKEDDWNPTTEELFADDYFEKFVDPESGVVSYWFKNETIPPQGDKEWNTQSNYFVTKAMTDDARFCYILTSTREIPGKGTEYKGAYAFDFKTRKLYSFPGHSGCYPYLDPKEDKLYWYVMNSKNGNVRDGGTFWMKDLLNAPTVPVRLASLPKAVAPEGSYVSRALSHITLTQDKQCVFLDSWIGSSDTFIQGMLNLYTGEWKEWNRSNTTHLTHGQINPKNDKEVLLSMDVWDDSEGVHHPMTDFYDKPGGEAYPRINIMSHDGTTRTIRTIDPRDPVNENNNYASHDMWHQDGDHIYWCASGVNIRNIRTGKHEYPYNKRATHCNLTLDMKYITLDNDQVGDTFRGGRWRVTFFNRETGKAVNIVTLSPAIATEAYPSTLHPDPHPHFVCNDKYIVCTVADQNKLLRWSITPVDQLIEKTK